MGMYTELRLRATVKHKYSDLVAEVTNNHTLWSEAASQRRFAFPWLVEAARWNDESSSRRLNNIPYGCSAYFDDVEEWKTRYDPKTRVWVVQCNLKNYGGEIEYFLKHMFPHLVESYDEVWYRYEEDAKPTRWNPPIFS